MLKRQTNQTPLAAEPVYRARRIVAEYIHCGMGWDRARVAAVKSDPEIPHTYIALVDNVWAGDEAGEPFCVLVKDGEVIDDSLPAADFFRV